MIADEDYGRPAIERIRDYIFNVYVQNHLITPDGSASVNTWKKGPVRLNHIGLWEQGGVRFEEVFEALRAIRYEGYVTVHQAFEGVMSVDEAAKKSADYLRTLVA
jgi:sugar phosphate isomerase/epimerase